MSPRQATSRARSESQADVKLFVFAGLLALRVINGISIATFFQPDEYFQSLEPAWRAAFGVDSGAWITWEWKEQLRSSLHPMLFAGAYRAASTLADWTNLLIASRAQLLLLTPKLLQSFCAALGDFYTWRLACRLYQESSKASQAALALTVCSAWQWFCSVRTLSNSIETTLTIFALYHWPWQWCSKASDASIHLAQLSLSKCLIAAAVACILRPTNVMIWIVVSISTLVLSGDITKALVLARQALFCGGTVLAVSSAVDWKYFGYATFPPLRFLYFNLVQSLAVFYGRNRTDYYVTEGLPLLLTAALPFALLGLWQALNIRGRRVMSGYARFTLAATAILTVVALSVISHKEVRFIYPLLPILHVLAAPSLAAFVSKQSFFRLSVLAALVCINVGIASYVGLVHQRGVIDVLHFLRHEQESLVNSQQHNISVGFLMPCHSTPWRSHLIHPQIEAWALTCEPPLHVPMADRKDYLDEADEFYTDPKSWIERNMGMNPIQPRSELRPWPQYLVFFEQLQTDLEQAMQGSSYEECWRGFNTHWHDDWRRRGDVVVWCLPRDPREAS